ncbi:MAG TPA: four helix bundle protein [Opitutaceae bacterium]|nr:four helix bundle protein [Opitutaceae bacterium]
MKTTIHFSNPPVQSYHELEVWKKGIEIAKLTYFLTRKFPVPEKFGLVSQMRRAAVSISSNIAEGQARHTTGEFIQFISHAEGSVAELSTQFYLSAELELLTREAAATPLHLLDELRRMLNGLRRKLARLR